MKKICYVTTVPGTIRSFLLKSIDYLHRNTDWDISIICDYDQKFENELPKYIHYYPIAMKRGISLSGIKAMNEMRKLLKKEKFDLIQYSTPNAAFYASIASKLAGTKIRIYHLMGLRYINEKGIFRYILKAFDLVACKLSTHIECVSKSNYQMGIEEGLYSKEKATVIWNGSSGGVDLDRFDYKMRTCWRKEIRKELNYDDQDFVFGFVGRITKDKGINELLSAYFKLSETAKCLIVGREEGVDTLDKNLWEKAISHPNICIHEAVTGIEKYYAAIDVLVLPSYREGFGNVIIEAAALGTPSIVSNIPGPQDVVIDGETGLFCIKQDEESLYDCMNKMLHSNECVQMGINAREYVKNSFDSKILCQKILERKEDLLR